MIKIYFLFLLTGIHVFSAAQNTSSNLRFHLLYGDNEIVYGEKINLENDNWITFTKIKFYIGHPKYFEKDQAINSVQIQYYLVDFTDSSSLAIVFDMHSAADSLSILLGTDSAINVSGIFDGALDPLNGMYWAWNSGYINVKVEGVSSFVVNEDHKFEYHIGGYIAPNATARQICLIPNSEQINFNIDLFKVVQPSLLIDTPSITIPGKNASSFADAFKASFIQIDR